MKKNTEKVEESEVGEKLMFVSENKSLPLRHCESNSPGSEETSSEKGFPSMLWRFVMNSNLK